MYTYINILKWFIVIHRVQLRFKTLLSLFDLNMINFFLRTNNKITYISVVIRLLKIQNNTMRFPEKEMFLFLFLIRNKWLLDVYKKKHWTAERRVKLFGKPLVCSKQKYDIICDSFNCCGILNEENIFSNIKVHYFVHNNKKITIVEYLKNIIVKRPKSIFFLLF